ncbi:MAG: hypothetical protein ACQETB_13410 [Halobacteriota archaeon]
MSTDNHMPSTRRRVLFGLGAAATAANTQPVTATDVEISIGCYRVRTRGPIDRVSIRCDDGTVEFTDGYEGQTTFGYAGYAGGHDEAFDEWLGPIASVDVVAAGESRTIERTRQCAIEAVRFDCDTVDVTGTADDIGLVFADGVSKKYDPPAIDDETRTYGSPGRVLQLVSFEDMVVENPHQNCDLGPRAVDVDGDAVRIERTEYVSGADAVDSIDLRYTDGSTERIEVDGEFPIVVHGNGTLDGVQVNQYGGDVMAYYPATRKKPAGDSATERDGVDPTVPKPGVSKSSIERRADDKAGPNRRVEAYSRDRSIDQPSTEHPTTPEETGVARPFAGRWWYSIPAVCVAGVGYLAARSRREDRSDTPK